MSSAKTGPAILSSGEWRRQGNEKDQKTAEEIPSQSEREKKMKMEFGDGLL